MTLIIQQDGTGSKVMTANAAYKFAVGFKTLSNDQKSEMANSREETCYLENCG